MIGFLVCFLGDFAARAAYDAYLMYVNGSWSTPSCWDFKLVFYCNMTMGLVYGFVSLLLLIPGCDKMFYCLASTFTREFATSRQWRVSASGSRTSTSWHRLSSLLCFLSVSAVRTYSTWTGRMI